MNDTRIFGRSLSSWPLATSLLQTTALNENLTADVCVVGAGLAGMTTAYFLTRAGRSVVVLDKGPVGGGNTGRTTAQLSNSLDVRYSELVKLHGEPKARLAAHSHTAAIDMVEAIAREEKINCAFERISGYLFVPPATSRKALDEELEAAHRVGLTQVERVAQAPLNDFDTLPCLHFPEQGQFDPLAYLNGLAQAVQARGGQIYTDSPVESITDGQPAQVEIRSGFTVTAEAVVVATNSPINDRITLHTKQAPYLSYVIAAKVPQGSVTRALYWDTEDPYHYVRLQAGDGETDLLLVGGEDHKTGQADDDKARYGRLEAWARERFPSMQEVRYRWSGQVYESLDGLAYIGRNPGDSAVYVATGDSGLGMTHSTVAGMLICDLITGAENAWAAVYDPARKPFKAVGEFIRENANVGAQFTALVTPSSGVSGDEVAPGTGVITGFGPQKHAVYRDNSGEFHTHSAICPHLGCVVAWNHGEQTWDCPCHGSRFDAYGKVLNGPAHADLTPAEE